MSDTATTTAESKAANDSYHSRSELSSSQVAAFMSDPVSWHHVHQVGDWPKPEPTPAMLFGTGVHEMIEIGGPDHLSVVEIPNSVLNKDGHKRGKPWTEFRDDHPPETFFYREGETVPLLQIWENLNRNEHCVRWMAEPKKELELYWQDAETGLKCRAKLDVLSTYPVPCIVDWKTARDITPRGFQSAAYSMNYDIRMAFYRRGMRARGMGRELPIVTVAIENKGSHRVQPFELSSDWIDDADRRLSGVLQQIVEFDLGPEMNKGIVEISAPKWAQFDSEYQLDGEV